MQAVLTMFLLTGYTSLLAFQTPSLNAVHSTKRGIFIRPKYSRGHEGQGTRRTSSSQHLLDLFIHLDKVETKVSNCDSGLLQNQTRRNADTTRTSSIFRGLPEGMSSTTIEMLPCHRVRLPNALPNGLGQLLLHAPTLLVNTGLATIGTSIGSTSRALPTIPNAVHQAHLLIMIQVVP